MSPEVTRNKQYRIHFYSREEDRMHVHVEHNDGREVKVWMEPEIEVAKKAPFKAHEINVILKLCRENENEIKAFWRKRKKS